MVGDLVMLSAVPIVTVPPAEALATKLFAIVEFAVTVERKATLPAPVLASPNVTRPVPSPLALLDWISP